MESSYTIYNASAGSGKTFTLVKSFLKIILNSPNLETFKSLLAITFTNKAVNEMKERIIRMLLIFSDEDKAKSEPMFSQIAKELNITSEKLTTHSSKILQYMLHNYAALSITTIDRFNLRLIRSFAFDLRLNPNFEVFMDTDELLWQAVDNLLQKMGEDKQITQLLTDFSKDKINEDKNWDITQELLDVAKLLTIENNYEYLKMLDNKTLDDFEKLKQIIKKHNQQAQKSINHSVEKFFEIIRDNDLTDKDFNRGSVYKFFEKLKENPLHMPQLPFTTDWATQIEDKSLYSKSRASSNPEKALILDTYHSDISGYFRLIEKQLYQKKFYQNLLKNLIPLAVLSGIKQEIEFIKEQENILPISEFNNVIHQTIIGQPVPFIYERIGQRYRHYFIDEFQDTSALQWDNMLPLISEALQSENLSKQRGSLLLVGDAKQSIYRWRGGKAEQFMDLYLNEKNPFFVKPQIADLDSNYRSYAQIIEFNNDFFKFVSEDNRLFTTELYKNLYKGAYQNTHQKTHKGGLVSITFVNSEEHDEEQELSLSDMYSQAVIHSVNEALQSGFRQEDICVLTRTNRQGIVLAQSLTQQGFKVISPEALLLKNVPEIQFLIYLIKLSIEPNSQYIFAEFLFQYAQIKQITDIHSFISTYINAPVEQFLSTKQFSFEFFHKYSFYEGIAYAVKHFDLAQKSDAYLSHFMNLIFDFKNVKKGGIIDFLLYWEDKKDTLSISAPSGVDAISVMTVHKSKGLEFPVVIYAFVNDKLVKKNDKIWLAVDAEQSAGFDYLLVDDYAGLEAVNLQAVKLHSEQQMLDQLNIMYVAMTRAKAHLYIISQLENNTKTDTIKSFSGILKEYLLYQNLWEDTQFEYHFGTKIALKPEEKKLTDYIPFVQCAEQSNYRIVTRQGMLWDTHTQDAIEKGNIIHQLMAKIYTEKDVNEVLNEALNHGIISVEQCPILEQQIRKVINNETISFCFSDKYKVFNEREFISEKGEYQRPDRIVFDPQTQEVFVIDYKTGNDNPKYTNQLYNYTQTLTALGWIVRASFLVFINEEVKIIKM